MLFNTSSEPLIQDAYNYHLVGNNVQALKCLQKLKRKSGIILDEIAEDTEELDLKLLRLHAAYFLSGSQISTGLSQLDALKAQLFQSSNNTCQFLAARMYLIANEPEKALELLDPATDLSCNALSVQCLMAMYRYDLANKILRRMQVADEDALIVQLTSSLFYLTKGGDQLQEAFNCYEELREKYGSTSFLVNGQASALIGMGKWQEAEQMLQEALDLDGNNTDAIVNMIMVAHHLDKTESISRLVSRLRDFDKDHVFLTEQAKKDEEFTRCAQAYSPSLPS